MCAKKAKSRGNGMGSVYKLPNGKVRAVKTLGYWMDEDGKRHRRTTSKTYDKVTDAKKEAPYLAPRPEAKSRRTDYTLKEMYDLWEPTHQASKSTINCYRSGYKIFEALWDTPLSEADIDDLQECMDDTGKGKRTKQNAKTALGLVYKYAVPRKFAEMNLAEYLVIRDRTPNESARPAFTAGQLDKIKKAAGEYTIDGIPMAAYIYANCLLGFRPTAFLDLDVSSYNQVEKAFVGGIKTPTGIARTVTVSPKIQSIVNQQLEGKTEGPVFCSADGKRLSLKKYRGYFYTTLAELGIQAEDEHMLTPHSCRHTFATLMKKINAPDKDKLELIGHTSVEQLQYYQDVNYSDLRSITNLL